MQTRKLQTTLYFGLTNLLVDIYGTYSLVARVLSLESRLRSEVLELTADWQPDALTVKPSSGVDRPAHSRVEATEIFIRNITLNNSNLNNAPTIASLP
jgi:hypothetical protein